VICIRRGRQYPNIGCIYTWLVVFKSLAIEGHNKQITFILLFLLFLPIENLIQLCLHQLQINWPFWLVSCGDISIFGSRFLVHAAERP
jgi:hypothetical protein